MRAAVLVSGEDTPRFVTDFPQPELTSGDQVLLSMKAAAIKHLDRSRASGKHYSAGSTASALKVLGGDGVGVTADGARVFAFGTTGMAAEKAIAEKARIIPLPEGIDDATAAALPNAVAGSAMAILYRAGLKKGETVLINGATGFTGKIAIQLARYYGAGKIIATGRNPNVLQSLKALGADEVVSLKQEDAALMDQLRALHQTSPIDIVIDYLWGQPAALILQSLKGSGGFTSRTRFVSVGSMAGDSLMLSSEILRSVDLQLSGSGLGSWSKAEMQALISEIIPSMFALAAGGKLIVDTITLKLEEVSRVWEIDLTMGQRVVLSI